jgi:hypothetical protein
MLGRGAFLTCRLERCAPFGFMGTRISLPRDVLGTEVELGGEGVVSRAPEREILRGVLAAEGERHEVVELELVGLAATLPSRVYVRAARAVSLEDSAADASWDVTRTAC